MIQKRTLPNIDQISIIVAGILIAYAVSRLSNIPVREFRFQILGFFVTINLNIQWITIPIVTGLAASGSDWLIHSHPQWNGRLAVQHWLLPMLTALVLAFPITQLPYGVSWWLTFLIGAAILMAVLLAEYIIIDPHDLRQPLASSGLISVSFALYFIFCLAIFLFGYRLIFALPAIILASFLVSLRSFNLRFPQHWMLLESGLIALVAGQVATALHYWPISPISYSLAILGPTYAIFLLIVRLHSAFIKKHTFTEPLLILFLCWALAYWLK